MTAIQHIHVTCDERNLQDRLGAYVELSIKYAKSVIELNAAQLILDTDERHRIEYSLDTTTPAHH